VPVLSSVEVRGVTGPERSAVLAVPVLSRVGVVA
jgi:hypothetical protein